jgi:hypothetical protein
VVNPHLRDRAGDYAEEVGRLRWYLQQIVALGDAADGLTDLELRDRLLTLVETCGARWPLWVTSPDVAVEKRLLDLARLQGFTFQRVAR